MRVLKRIKERRGFSLAELLIVVAIIGILLAVAIPNVLSYYRELKLTELDDDARTIFLAAQNQLTALSNSGERLGGIGTKITNSSRLAADATPNLNYVEYKAAEASTTPTAPSATGLRKILPGGSVDTHFHKYNYVIEFDTESGAVYGVWYWEKEDFDYARKANEDRQKKEKRLDENLMVGFYGGDQIDRLQFAHLPYPSVQLINAEELRLVIGVPEELKTAGAMEDDIHFDVYINDATGKQVALFDTQANLYFDQTGTIVLDTLKAAGTYDDVPSTMGSFGWTYGMKYNEWVDKLKLKGTLPDPGEDISLTVKMSYTGQINGKSLTPSTLVVTGNSLFESIEADPITPDTYIANIAYGRHLQNLHDSGMYSGGSGFCSGVLSNTAITSAKQTRDINFAAKNPDLSKTENDVYYWASTYPETPATGADDPYMSLHPINNNNLTSYDGQNHEIRNMDAGHYMYAGLFSYVTGGTYKNITLINPHLHGDDTSTDLGVTSSDPINAGALIGGSGGEELTVENCSVYYEYVPGKDVGGWDTTFKSLDLNDLSAGTGNFDTILGKVPHIGAPATNSMSGGLIGNTAGKTTIRNCQVSVINIGAQYVGGLIGNAGREVVIENSYSGSFLYGNRWTGGLIGLAYESVTIKNSYAAGEIMNGYPDGFVGAGLYNRNDWLGAGSSSKANTVTDSYAAVRFVNADGTPRHADEPSKYENKTNGTVYGTFYGDDANYYVKQSGVKYGYNNYNDLTKSVVCGKPITTAGLTAMISDGTWPTGTNDAWNTGTGVTNAISDTHAYTLLTETKELEGKAYPYPMLKGTITGSIQPHYGDWLEEEAGFTTSFYWEKEGTEYHVYLLMVDSENNTYYVANDLCTEYHLDPAARTDIEDWGYAVIGIDAADLKLDGVTMTTATAAAAAPTYADNILGALKTVAKGELKDTAGNKPAIETQNKIDAFVNSLNAASSSIVWLDKDANFYSADAGYCWLELNLGFAAAIDANAKTTVTTQPTTATSMGKTGVPYQIRTVQQLDNIPDGNSGSYQQTHDLNGKDYTPTYEGPSNFSGTYNGDGYRILELNMTGGLFTSIGSSTLSGIILYSPTGGAEISISGTDAGGLAGTFTGSGVANIDNCVVAGYKLNGTGTGSHIGGLVGNVAGGTLNITSCEAVNTLSTGRVGGLVGYVANGIVSISDSYAGGTVRNGQYVGGVVGSSGSAAVNISYSNVYSYATVKGSGTGSQIYGIGPNASSTCRYWNDGCAGAISDGSTGVDLTDLVSTPSTTQQTYIPDTDSSNTDKQRFESGLTKSTETYPFEPKVTVGGDLVHYGDWPDLPVEPCMAYVEKYDTDEYGIYALRLSPNAAGGGYDIAVIKNTLQTGKIVVDDGLYIAAPEELPKDLAGDVQFTYESGTKHLEEAKDALGDPIIVPGYYLYTFDKTAGPVANYYSELKVKDGTTTAGIEYTFYYNAEFACEAFSAGRATITAPNAPLSKPEAEGQGTSDDYTGVVIRSARQLANMQAYTNSTATATAQAWTYDQLLDVNFATYTGTGLTLGKDSTPRLPPAQLSSGIYDGHGHTISNLYLGEGGTDPTGLFSTVGTGAVKNVTLKDSNVAGTTSASSVGALVGQLSGGKVENVKLNNVTVDGDAATSVGGLVGQIDNGTVNNAELIDVKVNGETAASGSSVGGLVGKLESGSISNSGIYVTANYTTYTVAGSTGSVGGLIGTITGGSVENSYAAVKVSGTGAATVGGFVGTMSATAGTATTTVKNCYAGGYVGADGHYEQTETNVSSVSGPVGGFVGTYKGGTFDGTCYSTASVGNQHATGAAEVGLFAGSGEPTPASTVTLYAVAKAFDTQTDGTVIGPRNETEYLASAPKATETASNAYKEGLDGYPYQSAGTLEHHGDWIDLTKGVYYDSVVSGVDSLTHTSYYANGVSGADLGVGGLFTAVVDDNPDYATDDGYMFLSEKDLGDELVISIEDAWFKMKQEADKVTIVTATGTTEYFAYKVPAAALNTMPKDAYYFTVNVNGQFFTANFAFAGEIFDYGKVTDLKTPMAKPGLTSDDIAIRTPRQLANAGILTNAGTEAGKTAQKLAYDQLLDLDFNTYKTDNMPSVGAGGVYNHEPITLEGETGQNASYNGHTYSIIGLKPGFAELSDNLAASGLFSRAKNATLTDIRIVNSTFTANTGVTGGTTTPTTPTTPTPTPGGGSTPAGTSHVLESASIDPNTASTTNYPYGDRYFTIVGANKFDTSGKKEWNSWGTENNYSVDIGEKNNVRIRFGEKVTKSNYHIKFTVSSKLSLVKIWWVAGDTSRGISILDDSGSKVYSSDLSTDDKEQFFNCELYESGTYYIGNTDRYTNYIFKVEVIEYPDASMKIFDPAGGLSIPSSGSGQLIYGDFVIHYNSSKTSNDKGVLEWSDGHQFETYLSLGGSISDTRSIEFATTDAARVVVWWSPGGNGDRYVTVKKGNAGSSGTEIAASSTDKPASPTQYKPYLSTFTLTDSGTYYLGGQQNCYIYRIVVIENGPLSGGPTGGTGSGGTTGGNFSVTGHKIRVGALAGILDNATVTNCGVYVKPDSTYATADEAYDAYQVKNTLPGSDTDYVGGLAGNVTDSTVEDSFAAVKVTGVSVVGGFAGRIGGTTSIDSCYVGGHTNKGTFFKMDGSTTVGIINVSATKDDGKNVAVGGFVGLIDNDTTITFTNVNYSTASFGAAKVYMGVTSENDTSRTSHQNADLTFTADTTGMGQFIGKLGQNNVTVNTTGAKIYAMGDAFEGKEYVGINATAKSSGYKRSDNEPYTYDFVKNSDKDDSKDAGMDVPYVNHLTDQYLNKLVLVADPKPGQDTESYDSALSAFPYPMAQEVHHGDWTLRYDLIYYEVYDPKDVTSGVIADTSELKQIELLDKSSGKEYVGFYAVLKDPVSGTNTVINTLSETGHVIDSGYMAMSDIKLDALQFSIYSTYASKNASNASVLLTPMEDSIALEGHPVDADGNVDTGTSVNYKEKFIYQIPFATTNLAPSDTYYMQVTINGQPYILNPHFACEAVNVGLLNADGTALDYDTIRSKPGLEYKVDTIGEDGKVYPSARRTETLHNETIIAVRSPAQLAGVARYTRIGNESKRLYDARSWDYRLMMDVDYARYNEVNPGKIYDGNTNNRSEPKRTMWFAGTSYPYGQATIMLEKDGKFYGNGHEIANLYLSSDSTKKEYVGFFGIISGEDTVAENLRFRNLHVNAWGGPDGGIYVGAVAGRILDGAVLQNVTIDNLEMDFHTVPKLNDDKDRFVQTTSTTKFNAVGGAVGQLVNGKISNVHVNGMSVNFESKKYSYNSSGSIEVEVDGKTEKDYYIKQVEGTGGSIKTVSSVKPGSQINIGGIIGEIDASAATVAVSDSWKAVVENVYLVNPKIEANKGKNDIVGGVIGKADGKAESDSFDESKRNVISITDCGVYIEDSDTNAFNTKYGVLYTSTTNSGDEDSTGGFIGRSDHYVSISNCFSAVRVWGVDNVGGFAGHIEGSQIEDCYSGGHTVGGTYGTGVTDTINVEGAGKNVGGFAGRIEASYNDPSGTGSFALRMSGVNFSTSSVKGPNDNDVGLFAGSFTEKAGKDLRRYNENKGISMMLYGAGKRGQNDASTTVSPRNESAYALTGAVLPGVGSSEKTADPATRYESDTATKDFLYANNTTLHDKTNSKFYGDWEELATSAVVYWEKEQLAEGNEVTHYYVVASVGADYVDYNNWLCTDRDGNRIIDWGYAVFSSDTGATITADGSGNTVTDEVAKKMIQDRFAAAKSVVILKSGKLNASNPVTVTVPGTGATSTFYVNTAYAKAISKDPLTGTFEIRTPEQLDNVVAGNSYTLTHDVDASEYLDSGNPKYTGAETYTGIFDGKNYRILNLSTDTGGLFASLSGATVQNVIMYVPSTGDTVTITGTDEVGGIAATTEGTVNITNCVVAGYEITSNGNGAGGLVGKVTGGSLTIEKSSATNKLKGANVGGLVGSAGGTLTIKDSYAGGEIETATNNAGGLVGRVEGTAVITYDNVYSIVDMTGVDMINRTYGIGPQVDTTAKDTVAFWGGGLENPNAEDQALGVSLLELASRTGSNKATSSLKPGATLKEGLTPVSDEFPYPEYSTNKEHYGAWPKLVSTSGYFYYEQEKVGSGTAQYHFYGYGAELVDIAGTSMNVVRGTRILDTLCYDRHADERANITASGYGFFTPNTNGATQSGLTIEDEAVSNLETALCKELGIDSGDYDIKTMDSTSAAYSAAITGTVTYGSAGEVKLDLYPAFGAGIYAKDTEFAHYPGETQFVVRTPGQLKNVVDNDKVNGRVAVTHDIDFGGLSTIYTPGVLHANEFDGGGYRLIDFKYEGSGDAALFTSAANDTIIRNVILYAPKNDGTITTTSGNAAGLVAAASNALTIDNCAVAGYTVTGTQNVGGLVGSATGSGSTIQNSEAVVTLSGGTSVGGLAGSFNGTITDSYSGGSITGASGATSVGGIVGTGTAAVTDSYTYMNLLNTGATESNVYAIGKDATVDSDSYYLKDYLPTGANTTDQGTGKTIEEMKRVATTTENVYVPDKADTTGLNGLKSWGDVYPFAAMVEVDGDTVHYGAWPDVAGIAQWERYTDDSYQVSIIGVDLWGDKLIDTLKKDPADSGVTASGYAVFVTTGKAMEIKDGLKGSPSEVSADEKAAVLKAINTALSGVGVNGFASELSKVYDNKDLTGAVNTKATVTVHSPTKASADLYYNPGTTGLGYNTFAGTTTEFKIRTPVELDGIPDSGTSGYTFKQTCDIDCSDYRTPAKPIYTGATGFAGTYDGQGYKILNLSISGTDTNVGLFASTESATLKNIILYSPDGSASISGTGKGSNGNSNLYGVGGIVGNFRTDDNTITNCVVAGYTISGQQFVGGIVGYAFHGGTVKNCASVNTIQGQVDGGSDYANGVGGIMGGGDNDSNYEVNIYNCYAGGTIKKCGTGTMVGGVYGENTRDDGLTVENCYVYVNMTNCGTGASVYAISGFTGLTVGEGYKNYYLNTCVPTELAAENIKGGTAKTYAELADNSNWSAMFPPITDVTAPDEATSSYVPSGLKGGTDPGKGKEKMDKNFPFPAVVREVNTDGTPGDYVHYGEWPEDPDPSGDPGIPEGPGMISAPLDALVPPALELPGETREEDPEADGHVEVVRRRAQTVSVRRLNRQARKV